MATPTEHAAEALKLPGNFWPIRSQSSPFASTFDVDKGGGKGGDKGGEKLTRIGRRSEYEFVLGRRSQRLEQAALDPFGQAVNLLM